MLAYTKIASLIILYWFVHCISTDNLISRKSYNVVPLKVEYSLIELGKTFIPVLDFMKKRGEYYIEKSANEQ
ncbi:hypothetical protein DIC82_15785 [Clostridium beijerinckii]|nr:hypothetical protein DIC82_15785 [Clostridium beijerinckii]